MNNLEKKKEIKNKEMKMVRLIFEEKKEIKKLETFEKRKKI